MRRITALLMATLLALAMTAGSALAFQPPGGPAQDRFGCVDGEDDPVNGHPGAAGLGTDGPSFVNAATPHEGKGPTAWNAVHRTADGIIDAGACQAG